MRNSFFLLISSAVVYFSGIVIGCIAMNGTYNGTCTHSFMRIEVGGSSMYFSYEDILLPNLKAIVLLMVGFAVITVVNLVFNGINLFFFYTESLKRCMHFKDFLLLTLPHGILEIPAIIIAGAAGFKIPYEIVRYLLGRKEQVLTKEDVKEYLVLALISIVLIVIAAWIEANVTLKIARSVLNSTKDI